MGHPRPFRFSSGAFGTVSSAEYFEQVRQAEALGYDVFLIPDHFNKQMAPGPALTAAALATTSIRLGTGVYANDYRHPVVLAKETATIDVLSDGRFEMGIGAGWLRAEYDQAGIPFNAPGTRVERMQEALPIIRGLWADGPFSYHGRQYTISDLEGWPKPVQRPGPPVFIGAGRKRLLSFAAREADIVGILAPALREGGLDIASDTEERLAQQVQWVREAAGDRFADIELAILFWDVRVTDNPHAAAEEIARMHDTFTPEQVLTSPYYLIGSIDGITERLQELRERFSISYFSGFARVTSTFAPVVARLGGT